MTLPLCWLGGGGGDGVVVVVVFWGGWSCCFLVTLPVSLGLWAGETLILLPCVIGGRAGFGDMPVTWCESECEADGFALDFQSLC